MSEKDEKELEYGSIDDIFDPEIKGKIDSPWRLQRQLERCNVLMSSDNRPAFEAAVRALVGDLPYAIKIAVHGRRGDYRRVVTEWRFKYCCGHAMGSLPEIGEDGEYKRDKKGLLIGSIYSNLESDWNYKGGDPVLVSPIKIEGIIIHNYETQFDIIKEEIELGKAGWQYDKSRDEEGAVERILPKRIVNDIDKTIKKLMEKHRLSGDMYSMTELIKSLQTHTIQTPTPPKEVEE